MMHRYTGNPAYLATATKLADFFTNAVTTRFKDNVPDFDLTYTGLAPYTNLSRRDASAAAIAASGLVELSTYVGPADGKRYRAYADAAIEALSTAPYKSDFAATEGAVMHCDAANCDVPWADFYLLEAIRRAKCLAAGAPCF
jgi:unsaturated chondroitin disaccharide hydrolase